LVQKSVLLKVSETPSLKLAPDASVPPDVDVAPDVLPHAARMIAMAVSAPSTRRRFANVDLMGSSFRFTRPDDPLLDKLQSK
jgi:hypothetical protein